MSYLRTWDCLAYVIIQDLKRVKLIIRAYECVFIGYATSSKACRFYDLIAIVIIESNDVECYENKFPLKSRNSRGTGSSHILVIRSTKSNDEVEIELRRSKRVRVVKYYEPDYAAYNVEEDPINLQEFLSSLDADLWQEAIYDKIDSLESNMTLNLVDLPPGFKPIIFKCVLKKKLKHDGTIDKYKRLSL